MNHVEAYGEEEVTRYLCNQYTRVCRDWQKWLLDGGGHTYLGEFIISNEPDRRGSELTDRSPKARGDRVVCYSRALQSLGVLPPSARVLFIFVGGVSRDAAAVTQVEAGKCPAIDKQAISTPLCLETV